MNNKFVVREFKEEDVRNIINLNNKVFSEQEYFNIKRNENWFNWKTKESPFGKSIIIVAENEKGEIIGSRIFWRWKFKIRLDEVLAYQPADTVVDPRYRGEGIFYKMTNFALQKAARQGVKFVYNFPNKNSLKGYLNLGWEFIDNINWFVKIKNPFYIFRKKNKAKNIKNLFEFNIDEKKLKSIKSKENYNRILKTKRTFNFLKWRYLDNPNFEYGIVSYHQNKKEIHSIFTIHETGNFIELFVVDIFGNFELLENILKELNEISKLFNVDAIFIFKNNYFNKRIMLRHGYLVKKNKNFVVLPIDIAFDKIVTDYDNWEMFGGLHDAL